ncbi:MAG: HIT domain-containing protein [Phycisphaeraceae bacterium]
MAYISGLDDSASGGDAQETGGCFLCAAADRDLPDTEYEKRLILKRDEHGILMLNRYPYTNGHLLVAPYTHTGDVNDLSPQQRAGLMELCNLGVALLRKTINPQGFNIGMNLGRCAGAGLPGHAHMHVVPRWNGDVNFMQTVGQVRVIPQALEESYRMLRSALA